MDTYADYAPAKVKIGRLHPDPVRLALRQTQFGALIVKPAGKICIIDFLYGSPTFCGGSFVGVVHARSCKVHAAFGGLA